MQEQTRQGAAILQFFGLESRAAAATTLRWTFPYIACLGSALAGLSWLSNRLLRLSVWVYALAITLALLYVFLFLARVHRLDLQAREGGENRED